MRNTPADQRGTWATFAKAARVGARISQSELARRLGVDRTTIFRWESGRARPESAEMIRAFADVLGIDLEETLAAAGLRPGVRAPRKPTREPDAEIDMVTNDPQLDDEMKVEIIGLILERRRRDQAAAMEETRKLIEFFRRRGA